MTRETDNFDKFKDIQFVSGTDVSNTHCQSEIDKAFSQGLFTTDNLSPLVYKDSCLIGKTSGQDYKISLIPKEFPTDLLLGVFDGHGVNGHFYSQFTAKLLAKKLLLQWGQLRLLLEECKEPDEIVFQSYNQVDQVLKEMSKTNHYITKCSGTTASLLAIMEIKGERYLLASNLGDSEIIIEEINRHESLPDFKINQPVDLLYRAHNCDNLEAVNEYLEYTHRCGVLPLPIYYSRINCPGHCNPIWPQISDKNGKPCPLTVYQYNQITRTASPDLTSYEKISQFFPDGQQTRRRPPNYTREDGRVVVKSGFEGDNWGNTLNGTIQLLKCFGDYNLDPHINRQPNVSVKQFKEGYIALSSDGFGDLFRTTTELMSTLRHVYEETTNLSFRVDVSCFYEKVEDIVYKIAEFDEMYGVKCDATKSCQGLVQPKRIPKWDDWSLIFHYLPRIEKPKQLKKISTRNRHGPILYTPSFENNSYTESKSIMDNTFGKTERKKERKEIPWVLDRWWDKKHFYYKYSWRQADILDWNPQNRQLHIHYTGWNNDTNIKLNLDYHEDRKRFISDGTLLNEIQLKKSGPNLIRLMLNGELRLSGPIYNTQSKKCINGDIFLSQSQIEKCHYYQKDISHSELSHSQLFNSSISDMSIDDKNEDTLYINPVKQQKRPTRQSQRIYNKRKNKITSDM